MDIPAKKNIAVMGAGAIGSVIGGMLAVQGHNVTLVGRDPHMEAVSGGGLHITGIWGTHRAYPAAVTSPPHKHMDIIFITVKSFDTAEAARQAMCMVGPGTTVISMQNGLGNIETVAGIAGKERTMGAMAIFGAILSRPGSVEVTVIASETLVGEVDGTLSQRAISIAGMLEDAGVPTKPSDHIMQDVWHKALYNIALNPLSALLEVPYGDIADNPHTRWLIERMIHEAFEVAKASGVELGIGSAQEYLDVLWEQKLPPTREHRSSMLQDILRGKPTEIEHINGAVVRLGGEYGVATPYNSAVVRMVKAKEEMGSARQ